MGIPLTSDPVPTARIGGDPKQVALLGEAVGFEVEGGVASAARATKGKRGEYRCAGCGYGIIVYGQPPGCPICRGPRWEHVEWRPFSLGLDVSALLSHARSAGASIAKAQPEVRSLDEALSRVP